MDRVQEVEEGQRGGEKGALTRLLDAVYATVWRLSQRNEVSHRRAVTLIMAQQEVVPTC